jgi:formate--tetrahydrofolate ligase
VRSDIDIAQAATLKPISEIAARLGIPEDVLDTYGRHKAKISLEFIDSLKERKNGKLILV